jgi:hypothetical protein
MKNSFAKQGILIGLMPLLNGINEVNPLFYTKPSFA